jgi:hypothetical protein
MNAPRAMPAGVGCARCSPDTVPPCSNSTTCSSRALFPDELVRMSDWTPPPLLLLSRVADGAAAGEISEEHRQAAVQELARRRGLFEERRAAEQAARLASVVPSPRRYGPGSDTAYLQRRTQTILARMNGAQTP